MRSFCYLSLYLLRSVNRDRRFSSKINLTHTTEALQREHYQATLAPKCLLSLKNVLETLEPSLAANYIPRLCRVTSAMINTLLDDKTQNLIR